MRQAVKVARIAGASRHSRLETEPREEGAGSSIPKLAKEGEKQRKITQHCAIFRNRKNAKRRESTNTGREPGLKGTGSGKLKPPPPPPPPPAKGLNIRITVQEGRPHWSQVTIFFTLYSAIVF